MKTISNTASEKPHIKRSSPKIRSPPLSPGGGARVGVVSASGTHCFEKAGFAVHRCKLGVGSSGAGVRGVGAGIGNVHTRSACVASLQILRK